ncbi:MAG: bifunctional hydroxymethylpyrimidine kinase/phosphomethylpyrimidine kinase [Acutalibacteraceae bacterium]|nr:bifunctional hydroxymethylpyrimidine kinase/phosphomethylpyrimidine kinase [Acutalibacteraceae bacterium]
MKNCLTIAGSDCSGGAGIQADIKTFCANGVYAMSVITSVVAENTSRVLNVYDLPTQVIEQQIDAVFEDIEVDGVKIGMIKSCEIMNSVANKLIQYRPLNVVVDPVMSAKDNHSLMNQNALQTLKEKILPLTTMLTPNIPEAEMLTGISIKNTDDIYACAKIIYDTGAKNVLIKGGHSKYKPTDILYDGVKFYEFTSERINTKNTHGTGCTLSSAITANLSKGLQAKDAVLNAKKYIYNTIKNSLEIGKGNGPLHHFYDYYNTKGFD